MLRLVSLHIVLVSLALSGCASGNHQSEEQAARAACEERQTSSQDMDACMDEMIAALQHASIPQRPQAPPSAPSAPRS